MSLRYMGYAGGGKQGSSSLQSSLTVPRTSSLATVPASKSSGVHFPWLPHPMLNKRTCLTKNRIPPSSLTPFLLPFVDDQKISGAPGQPEWFLPRASRLPPVLELPVGKLG